MISSTGTIFFSFFDMMPFSLIACSLSACLRSSLSLPLTGGAGVGRSETSVDADECRRFRLSGFSGTSAVGLIACFVAVTLEIRLEAGTEQGREWRGRELADFNAFQFEEGGPAGTVEVALAFNFVLVMVTRCAGTTRSS